MKSVRISKGIYATFCLTFSDHQACLYFNSMYIRFYGRSWLSFHHLKTAFLEVQKAQNSSTAPAVSTAFWYR